MGARIAWFDSRGLSIIPFALGDWEEIYAHGFTHEELAFGYEPGQRGETGLNSDRQVLSLIASRVNIHLGGNARFKPRSVANT